ncbi:MAG: T9SS type A sorting domain-containing protein [Bacteroidales bacterium]|nr:T9SS type A sorting domain-containing protein [Bacteroidales bacterium]
MKKLVSICFLSILLMMFGMQVQAQDCCFRIVNPSGDTLTGIANVPEGLPLNHSLNQPVVGGHDIYGLEFADCIGIVDSEGVSLEWQLILDGQVLTADEAAAYCSVKFQTYYNELRWIGQDMMNQVDIHHNIVNSNEYPGANGQITGSFNISNIHYDYFFFHFLKSTQTRVIIDWKSYLRDVQLVVSVRQRVGGTNNELHYDAADELNLGGHQSRPGAIIASDTINNRAFVELETTINSCEPVVVGMPPYTMDTTGDYKIAYVSTSCGTRIDSIVLYHFHHFVHPTTPTIGDSIFRYCQFVLGAQINLENDPNPTLASNDIRPQWSLNGVDFNIYDNPFLVNTDTAGVFTYYVKRFDYTTGCESEVEPFTVTIVEQPAGPIVVDRNIGYCVGDTATQLSYAAPVGQQVLWGTTPYDITLTTAPTPTTTAAGVQVYYLKLQEIVSLSQCVSDDYDSILVHVYDNPTVTLTAEPTELCFDSVVTLTATASMNKYVWFKNGVDMSAANTNVINVTNDNTTGASLTNKFFVYVEKINDYKTCHNTSDTVDVVFDSKMGAPVVATPAAVCGPDTVTCTATLGTAATGVKWYAADKTTVLGTALTYTASYTGNAVLYVSSTNDFGCESDPSEWTKVNVTVNDVPHVTITHDDSVCAESNMTITATVVDSTSNSFTYAWNGVGLVAPLNQASVIFNHDVAGTYTDTLVVTDGNGCSALATTTVVVDSLPIIVIDINYTVSKDNYCVDHNGQIIFTTPDYAGYKIRTTDSWQTSKEFLGLAPATYQLQVKDGKGCVSHPVDETLIQDTVDLTSMDALLAKNTRCTTEFNEWNGSITVIGLPTPDAGGTYSYRLNGGAAQVDSIFSNLAAATYTVEVGNTVTGCKIVKDFAVEDSLTYPDFTVEIKDNTHCVAPFGGSIAVTSVVPEGTYKYKLDAGSYVTDTVFTALKDSTYTVYVKNQETACESHLDTVVKFAGVSPTATISSKDHVCYGDTTKMALITTGDVVFDEWAYAGPAVSDTALINSIKHQQSFALPNFPAGKHSFTATFHDSVTHCVDTVSKTIRVIPVNIDLHRTTSIDICEGDSAKVYCQYFPDDTADHIVSYTWYAHEYTYPTPGRYDTISVVPTVIDNRVSIIAKDNYGCTNSKYIDLEVFALPDVIFSGDTDYCEKSISAVSVTTSNPSPLYTWTVGGVIKSTSDTLKMNVGTSDFTAVVSVLDGHGCVNVDSVLVNVVANPGAPVFTPNHKFFCDSIDIHVTNTQNAPIKGDIVWSPANPDTVKLAGTYTAHYTYTEGAATCVSADSTVIVSVPGHPEFDLVIKSNGVTTTIDSTCVDSATKVITFAGSVDNPNMSYVYIVNGDTNTTRSFEVTSGTDTTYTYEIKAVGTYTHPDGTECTATVTDTFTYVVYSNPVKPVNFPDPYHGTPTVFYCAGSNASYNFTIPTGSTATYTPDPAPTTATTNAKLKITNEHGCSATFNYNVVEVALPVPSITSNVSAKQCGGDTIVAALYGKNSVAYPEDYKRTYIWTRSSDSTFSVTDTSYINFDTLSSITYTQDETDTLAMKVSIGSGEYFTNCYSSAPATFTITFQELPGKPALNPTAAGYFSADSAVYCFESIINLTAANFQWNRESVSKLHILNGASEISNINAAGTYKIVANNNDEPKCPGDTLTFTVIKNRELKAPADFASYDGMVKHCASATAEYDFGALANVNDTLFYLHSTDTIAKPTANGDYTIRIADKTSLIGCYKDFNYTIKEVADPTYQITAMSPDWANMKYCEGTTIPSKTYHVETYAETHSGSNAFTYKWELNGDSVSNLNTFASGSSLSPITANDTIQHFVTMSDTTTWGTTHSIVCYASDTTDILVWYFYKKLGAPSVNVPDSNNICDGDTLAIAFVDTNSTSLPFAHELKLHNTGDNYNYNDTVITDKTIINYSFYTDFTTCRSDADTVKVYKRPLPTVSITPASPTICIGDSATLVASGADTYVWENNVGTTSTVKVPAGTYIVTGTKNPYNCKNTDTVTVDNHPAIKVTMSPDTLVCLDAKAMICATPSTYASYQWYKDGAVVTEPWGNTACPGLIDQPTLSPMTDGVITPFVYGVKVTDANGCVSPADSNTIEVSVANNPVFAFYADGGYDPVAHTGTQIDHLDAHVGEATPFEMVINTNCWKPDEKIYLHFQFIKDDTITMSETASVLAVCTGTSNTAYEVYTADCAPMLINAPGYSTASGNIPNNYFISTESNPYKWFYLHFMDQRRIKVNMGNWLQSGKYQIVYQIVKTNSSATDNYQYYKPGMVLGGNNGVPGTEIVAQGVMTFNVDTVSSGNADIETPTAIASFENNAEMGMHVYPNPANNNVNVAVTGLQGQSILAVYDMSGKTVTSQMINVDYEGQIFTLPVNNFSQGIYFIKVVNGNAVMTKKLIIAR